ncbi:hypothetical protein [Glycomyces sp. NPDC048151]|uniref:hypothetical protein n=1 Tax=Glycomyces sp. NPDC048151 TaxID=3364002 RepID=UPI0037114C73
MDPKPPAPDPEPQPPTDAPAAEMPILVRPVPTPSWPKVIARVRVLTGWQVALVMLGGNCSFGVPLAAAISGIAMLFGWDDVAEYGAPLAWAVGFAAIFTHAYFTTRWAGRADRRARITVVIAMVVLATFTAITVVFVALIWPALIWVVLLTAAPSLIIQTVVPRCAFGPEGRRWFGERDEQ